MPDLGQLLLDYMNLDRALTPEERRRLHNQGPRRPYRKSRPTALPGPDGQTCGSCANLQCNATYNKRRFYKCGKVQWTHGAATDVRKKDPACQLWEPKDTRPAATQERLDTGT